MDVEGTRQAVAEAAADFEGPAPFESKGNLLETDEIIRRFLEMKAKDIAWRLSTRKLFAWILLVLLIIQNIVVFGLIFWAFHRGELEKLQVILSIVVPATLAETVVAIKIIVEWLFKEIDYSAVKK